MTDELVVISGAAGALGRGIVERLLSDGRTVLALGRDRRHLDELDEHPRLERLAHDVRCDPAPVRTAVGPRGVRGLVHAAGLTLGGSILEVSSDDVLAAIEVKVMGLVALTRGLLDRMVADARIIAVGGNLGFDPMPGAATPGIGNAAQAAAIRQLNRAVAGHGVTCHTVAPGPVDTPRFSRLVSMEAERRGIDADAARAQLVEASPLQRPTTVAEVAWAVARLLEPEAAALAGSTLLLDTGRRTALP